MDRWEDLVRDFERAIDRDEFRQAARLLAEFTLSAPAASVRSHHAQLVKASAGCADAGTREHLIATLELLKQRASLTASSFSLVKPERPGQSPTRVGDGRDDETSARSDDWGRMSRQELYDRARGLGIPGRSRMNKRQLERAVTSRR